MKTITLRSLAALAASGVLLSPAPARGAGGETEALAAFGTIQKVLQSPRCVNCHIPGDAPLQGETGTPHTQNVLRGIQGKGVPGLACADCHAAANTPESYGPNMPPGAPGWHLPPPALKMVFQDLSGADLCASLKDPKRNGGKDLAALVTHLEKDPLVLWGWSPGDGRAPVSVPHAELVKAARKWAAAGGPCPTVRTAAAP